MTDTSTATAPTDIEQREALEELAQITKKGFSLQDRLKKRGLRKATITLFLDEDLGPKLGWAYDQTDQFGNPMLNPDGSHKRVREGVVGELESVGEEHKKLAADKAAEIEAARAAEEKAATITSMEKALASIVSTYTGREMELMAQRDRLIAELTKTAIVISMKAVPAVIQKDMRRRAKASLAITDKGIPEDRMDEFNTSFNAHLMAEMFQSVTDNESGEINDGVTYEDAMALQDYLPGGQLRRLQEMIAQVQFTDQISLSIESQEDFS